MFGVYDLKVRKLVDGCDCDVIEMLSGDVGDDGS